MKRLKNIWKLIISFDNLYKAYLSASKGKRDSLPVIKFRLTLEENLIVLQNELIWHMWRPTPLAQFYVYEPKKRSITPLSFRDRIVSHAVIQIIEPFIDNRLIYDTHACRRGHGQHLAAKRVQYFMRKNIPNCYYYKGDIHHYFNSINHSILKMIIRKYISDKEVIFLLDTFIDAFEPGVPIGWMTSEIFANLYLAELDHYVKTSIKAKYYTRFMDDFVIVGDKYFLKTAASKIETFCRDSLRLELNSKSRIGKTSVEFCGYRIFRTHMLPKKETMKRAKRRLNKLSKSGNIEEYRSSTMSFLGYVKHCNAYESTKSILSGRGKIG
jgi:retron-type reverse transcriptase